VGHRGLSPGEAVSAVFSDDEVEAAPDEVRRKFIIVGGHLAIAVKEEEGGQLFPCKVAPDGETFAIMAWNKEVKAAVGLFGYGKARPGVEKKAEDVVTVKGAGIRHN